MVPSLKDWQCHVPLENDSLCQWIVRYLPWNFILYFFPIRHYDITKKTSSELAQSKPTKNPLCQNFVSERRRVSASASSDEVLVEHSAEQVCVLYLYGEFLTNTLMGTLPASIFQSTLRIFPLYSLCWIVYLNLSSLHNRSLPRQQTGNIWWLVIQW